MMSNNSKNSTQATAGITQAANGRDVALSADGAGETRAVGAMAVDAESGRTVSAAEVWGCSAVVSGSGVDGRSFASPAPVPTHNTHNNRKL